MCLLLMLYSDVCTYCECCTQMYALTLMYEPTFHTMHRGMCLFLTLFASVRVVSCLRVRACIAHAHACFDVSVLVLIRDLLLLLGRICAFVSYLFV